jgi:hypothetical protein
MDISFSIDESKVATEPPQNKCYDFATLIPGQKHTYTFTDETSYYQHYAQSYYAFTCKKIGWDCLRHYEIIAAGCIPYFTDLEDCPENTLVTFPKELIKQAMQLPGINPATHKIDHSLFPKDTYYALLSQLLTYTRTHLTCQAIAKRFLLNCGITNYNSTKVLYKVASLAPDYQCALLLIGLKRLLGQRCHAQIDLPYLYKDYPENHLQYLYGNGFSYTRLLPPSLKTENDPPEGPFDLVIYGSCHRTMLEDTSHLANKTVYVCGEDDHICQFLMNPEIANNLFIRELGTATYVPNNNYITNFDE